MILSRLSTSSMVGASSGGPGFIPSDRTKSLICASRSGLLSASKIPPASLSRPAPGAAAPGGDRPTQKFSELS
jgi:hypothetical protein